jgi:hypothetical protein
MRINSRMPLESAFMLVVGKKLVSAHPSSHEIVYGLSAAEGLVEPSAAFLDQAQSIIGLNMAVRTAFAIQ